MSDQYQEPFTHLIVTDIQNGKLDKERVRRIQAHFASQPNKDPKYLASLEEAIKLLYGPQELVKRMRNREEYEEGM